MEMNFRVKEIPDVGYFAQVELIDGWKRIGGHVPAGQKNTDYWHTLYDEWTTDHPIKSFDEAMVRCKNYRDFVNRKANTIIYHDVDIGE